MGNELKLKIDENGGFQLIHCADCGGFVDTETDAIPTLYRCANCGRWAYGEETRINRYQVRMFTPNGSLMVSRHETKTEADAAKKAIERKLPADRFYVSAQ